jgi:uncharacterized protein (TIGR02300 family)
LRRSTTSTGGLPGRRWVETGDFEDNIRLHGRADLPGPEPGGKGFDRLMPVWQMAAILSIAMIEGGVMPKEEWGVKRVCPTTGKRFYDLNRDPIVSPYTGEVVEIETGKSGRSLVADKSDKKADKAKGSEEEGLVLEDDLEIDESDDSEVEIEDDDVLDDDDDSDTVALDDLADVASDDDES